MTAKAVAVTEAGGGGGAPAPGGSFQGGKNEKFSRKWFFAAFQDLCRKMKFL